MPLALSSTQVSHLVVALASTGRATIVHPEVKVLPTGTVGNIKSWLLWEIGLDYHWIVAPKTFSRKGFSSSDTTSSRGLDLPFISAYVMLSKTLMPLSKSEGGSRGGIMHSFSRNLRGSQSASWIRWWSLFLEWSTFESNRCPRSRSWPSAREFWLRQMPLSGASS